MIGLSTDELYNKIVSQVVIALAKESQRCVAEMSFRQREEIIGNIRKMTLESAELFAKMAVEETGMGNAAHKVLKHKLAAEKTPGTEDITLRAVSGNNGLALTEMAPFGVIGAITPSTNPSETVISNSIAMLAGGNTIVFSPHPSAMKTSLAAIDMVNRASETAGGPKIAFTAATEVLMDHKDIALIVATGGPGLVSAALKSGKRAIGAGAGHPPVLVDDSADICKAAKDIIDGASFDNNLPCIAEKVIVAVASVADELMRRMVNEQGCYSASKVELAKLESLIFTEKGSLSRGCVGRSAEVLLRMIGVSPPSGLRCIVFEGEEEHPLIAKELMMPILGMVRAAGFYDATEKALRLEHGNLHSAHIHSKNIDHLNHYAKAMGTTVLVKNAPSYAALGFGGERFCTFTIASRTGEGLTSASTFTRKRLIS